MLSYAENPVNGIFSHTAAILPRNGSARLHIPRGQRGRGQNPTQRGGGCAMPLRGQAPVTPNSLILRSFHLAPRYKTEIFVDGTRADAVDLPDMQIFKAQFRRDPTASAAHPN